VEVYHLDSAEVENHIAEVENHIAEVENHIEIEASESAR